jgi:hypothetical protein
VTKRDDWDAETFRAAVEENLTAGAFHLLFAVDSITPELKDVVEYLNDHMGDEVSVLALQLRYVGDGDVEIVVPDLYGSKAVRKKAKRQLRLTEDQF